MGLLGDLRAPIIGLVLFGILMLGFFGEEELTSSPVVLSFRVAVPDELFWVVSGEEANRGEIFREPSELFVLLAKNKDKTTSIDFHKNSLLPYKILHYAFNQFKVFDKNWLLIFIKST